MSRLWQGNGRSRNPTSDHRHEDEDDVGRFYLARLIPVSPLVPPGSKLGAVGIDDRFVFDSRR